ncbi:MAG: ABC transporter permease, partial [Rubrobacteraceae bacterium]|nr:ABC transporter permease [Rubrobacteraceae bacterium]
MKGTVKPLWLTEMVAVWGYVQRNYFLTKRYFMWEVVWLVYVTMNAMAITFIGAGAGEFGARDAKEFMTFLL